MSQEHPHQSHITPNIRMLTSDLQTPWPTGLLALGGYMSDQSAVLISGHLLDFIGDPDIRMKAQQCRHNNAGGLEAPQRPS